MLGSSTRATGRVTHDILVFVPHERFDEYLRMREGFSAEVHGATEFKTLPRRYSEHPVVTGQPPGSAPVASFNLFVDGVAYSLTDTVIGFWLINQITGKCTCFAWYAKN